MNDYYKKEYSWIMDREMEHAIFGDSGRLCVAFGPQNGHTYDFRNFGMIDTIAPWIEAGKLRVALTALTKKHGLQKDATNAKDLSFRKDGSAM